MKPGELRQVPVAFSPAFQTLDGFGIWMFWGAKWIGTAYGSSPRRAMLRAIQLRACLTGNLPK